MKKLWQLGNLTLAEGDGWRWLVLELRTWKEESARSAKQKEQGATSEMASGWGITGNKGRCYDFWIDFSECMSQCREPKDCALLREDYLECLHHSKEVNSSLPFPFSCILLLFTLFNIASTRFHFSKPYFLFVLITLSVSLSRFQQFSLLLFIQINNRF